MTKSVKLFVLVAMIVVLGQAVRLISSPSIVESLLGVTTPAAKIEKNLTNVELFPSGLARVQTGTYGDKEHWHTDWVRQSDVVFIDTSEQGNGPRRSEVWWEDGKIIICHQTPLVSREVSALVFELTLAGAWSFLIVPSFWAFIMVGLAKLILDYRQNSCRNHNRLSRA